MNHFLKIILLALVFGACDGRRNVRDFYYPVDQLHDGQVYVYDLVAGQDTVRDYWYFRTFVRDSGIFLAATNYAPNFEVSQIVREKITPSGSLAREYIMYESDSATNKSITLRTKIDAPDVFPFEVRDSLGVFLFSISYWLRETPNTRQYVIRNRRYLGAGPDFELAGKKYPTIRFGIRELVGNEQEGSLEIPGRGEEWYAEGIGLVHFEKTYGERNLLTRSYWLRERISMSELENRARR
jgi:hypothetical protein